MTQYLLVDIKASAELVDFIFRVANEEGHEHCNCNCNCNLFSFRKSRLGYNPVDIEIVTHILYNTIYTLSGES